MEEGIETKRNKKFRQDRSDWGLYIRARNEYKKYKNADRKKWKITMKLHAYNIMQNLQRKLIIGSNGRSNNNKKKKSSQ